MPRSRFSCPSFKEIEVVRRRARYCRRSKPECDRARKVKEQHDALRCYS
ncbi:MAG: hypothetical protein SW833_24140 [Cyanobacteriota bacterium]|nr:hypothetical protein [Cyanobacteriota bacterium]